MAASRVAAPRRGRALRVGARRVALRDLRRGLRARTTCCVAVMLLLAVVYAQTRDAARASWRARWRQAWGCPNHQTFVFTAAPLVAWALWTGRKELLQPRDAGHARGPVRGWACRRTSTCRSPRRAHAPVTWGAADTWQGFWTHVLRREYGTFQLAPSGHRGRVPIRAQTVGAWASDLFEQIGWWGLPLALARGAFACWRASAETRLGAAMLVVPPVSRWASWRCSATCPVTRRPAPRDRRALLAAAATSTSSRGAASVSRGSLARLPRWAAAGGRDRAGVAAGSLALGFDGPPHQHARAELRHPRSSARRRRVRCSSPRAISSRARSVTCRRSKRCGPTCAWSTRSCSATLVPAADRRRAPGDDHSRSALHAGRA